MMRETISFGGIHYEEKINSIIFLLSVQLYGCSNNLTDHQETVVPVTELSLVEENSPEESATTVEEFNNDNAAPSLETGSDPETINSTDGKKQMFIPSRKKIA